MDPKMQRKATIRNSTTVLYQLHEEPTIKSLTTIYKLLEEYADVFDEPENVDHHFKHDFEFEVKLSGTSPDPATLRPLNPTQNKLLIEWTEKALKKEWIRGSSSRTAAPVFFVKKPCRSCLKLQCTCGQYDHLWRPVIDFTALNKVTERMAYPIPSVNDLLHNMAGHECYFEFGFSDGFYGINVKEEDRSKLAFVTPIGLKEWNVMPTGTINAPAYFQRFVDAHMAEFREWLRYFSDEGRGWADDLHTLSERARQMLDKCRQCGLRLKREKWRFGVKTTEFLGFSFNKEGKTTDPNKVGMVEMPDPVTKKDVKHALGLWQIYRQFFYERDPETGVYHGLSHFTTPLFDQTKNAAPDKIVFDGIAKRNWYIIKSYWCNAVNLAVYHPELPVLLYTDASDVAYGGFLMHPCSGPLAFYSREFSGAESNWDMLDKEFYSLVYAHKKFGHMLRGDVTWKTDSQANAQVIGATYQRLKWKKFLQQFPYRIAFVKGKNTPADHFTRHSTLNNDAEPPHENFHDNWRFYNEEEAYYKDSAVGAIEKAKKDFESAFPAATVKELVGWNIAGTEINLKGNQLAANRQVVIQKRSTYKFTSPEVCIQNPVVVNSRLPLQFRHNQLENFTGRIPLLYENDSDQDVVIPNGDVIARKFRNQTQNKI